MEHTLIVAGIGPGGKDFILPKALTAIKRAHYLVGGHRALSDYASENQETYAVTGKLAPLAQWIKEALSKDDVVVMVSFDCYSRNIFCAGRILRFGTAMAGI